MSSNDNVLEEDPRKGVQSSWQGAVLLSNEIKHYVALNPPLIEEFEEKCLRPASYNLRLGAECRLGGKSILLDGKKRYFEIPPYEVAVISTHEKLNVPRFLIGRWNLRVKLVYEGLLWVGGPQVDPGYKGHLYCPLYNLSDRKIVIEYKEPIATIDFVRTTPFSKGCLPFNPTRTDSLAAHDIHQLRSGPLEAWTRVEDVKRRIDTFQATVLPLIALIFTALAIIVSVPRVISTEIEKPVSAPLLMIIIAAIATFLSGWLAGRNWRR